MRALLALALLASATQLSCSVNDYCLNCENGDGGNGDGNGDADGGGGSDDAMVDAGCIPTGPEECDGKDNDCDGLQDEEPITGVGVLCANQNGACAGGVTQCVNGVIKCDKAGSPETCNGLDDNCSGAPDEGDPGGGGKCGTDMGECVAGQFHCDATSGTVECFGFIDHTGDPELCDAKDNDCDGQFDENLTNLGPCGPTTNTGECNIGTLMCQGGGQICTGAVFAKFETCNNKDDDCDSNIDEIFNKQTDIMNCGTCGTVCQPTSKTCINTTNMTNGTPCTTNADCTGGTCAVNSQPRCVLGGCSFSCNAGFQNKDMMASNGCEFFCFATGAEECDGVDNDCDGNTDEGLTPPPICRAGGECGATAPTAVCNGAAGWTCTYTGVTQFPSETLCDNKDNDCDGNVDEAQKNLGNGVTLGAACSVVPETACTGMTDDDNDGFVNDGCPVVGTAETACNDVVDDDADGFYNDGCPAHEERGVCKSTGAYTCDPANLNGAPKCTITMPGANPDPNETCDAKDNDCDGKIDEGGNLGTLAGQEWVDIGGGKQMMKYEASKPDATTTDQGTARASDPTDLSAYTCSRAGVQPWTNLRYQDAVAACAKLGATLCSEVQWHRACSAVTGPAYPITISAGTYIEAEDYQSTQYAGQPESGAQCSNTTDDDADGVINDGCPTMPLTNGVPEQICGESPAVDNDGDGFYNDGCPAIGPHAWVEDYTTGFSGIAGVEATPNLGATFTSANLTGSPYLDFTVDLPTSSSGYRVYVKMFASSASSDTVFVKLVGGASTGTAIVGSGNYNTWRWIDAGALSATPISGTQTIRIFMGKDGVKLDKIYVVNGAPGTAAVTSGETINGKGGKWAYATSPNSYQATTCNGDDLDTNGSLAGDQDDILTTGSLTSCRATTGTGIFDMSGNVKEWTLAHAPGENPIRGGASNNTGEGISCPLNFTLADDSFFFPNIGFRCCR